MEEAPVHVTEQAVEAVTRANSAAPPIAVATMGPAVVAPAALGPAVADACILIIRNVLHSQTCPSAHQELLKTSP